MTLSKKIFFDALSPRPAQLLHLTLSDLLPHYNHASASADRLIAPGFHHVYFPLDIPASQLLPDGTDPAHLPPAYAGRKYTDTEPPPRRLWAGGTLLVEPRARASFQATGADVVCIENVVPGPRGGAVSSKVDIWRRYGLRSHVTNDNLQARDVLIWEKRTLAFLPPLGVPRPAPAPKPSGRACSISRSAESSIVAVPSSTHLFSFSALSYNAHRIHFDPEYARSEGHRAPLVHGPLAQILMLAMVRMRPPGWRGPDELHGSCGELPETVVAMEYRNVAPLYCGEPMTVSALPKYVKLDDGGSGGASAQLEGRHSIRIQGSDGRLAARSIVYTCTDTGSAARQSSLLGRFRGPDAVY